MTRLSVNVNKIATLRNARGKQNPDLLKMTLDIIRFGAQGITVHPRPDERHIRKADVFVLAENISVELNVEGYPSQDFLELIREVKPAQTTLVPDPPYVLTSNAGWNVVNNFSFLCDVVSELQALGTRVSLFMDPQWVDNPALEALSKIQPNRVELYTEAYATHYGTPQGPECLSTYVRAAKQCRALGIGLNAGHDLSLENLHDFIQAIPEIEEVSIGHALICDALYNGIERTISEYLGCLSHNSSRLIAQGV